MKKLFLLFIITFGLVTISNSQTRPRDGFGMKLPAPRINIDSVLEKSPGVVVVYASSDHFPVKMSVNGQVEREVGRQNGNKFSITFSCDPVFTDVSPMYRKYVIYMEYKGYNVTRSVMFASSSKVFGVGEREYDDWGDEDEEIEVVYDFRTPPPKDSIPPKEQDPLPEFDIIDVEYDARLGGLPVRVVSVDTAGRSYSKPVGFLASGYRVDQVAKATMIGASVEAVPFQVQSGRKVYRITIITSDQKRIRRKIVILTDAE